MTRAAPRAERLLQLASAHYGLRRTSKWPYLLRGERRYLFDGQDRRDLGAQLRELWRLAYPDDPGVPSREDIAQVLADLRLHAELTELDPVDQAAELLDEHGIDQGGNAPSYYVEDGCTWWRKPAQGGGIVPVMLATFAAEIGGEVTLDDGAERTLTWRVHVTAKDGREGEVQITPDQLGRPQQWAAKAAGTSALVMPGLAIADHLRVAVQSTSEPVRQTVYTHTGWRRIGGQWAYLTSSGALGAAGQDTSVTVDLGPLSGYSLPAATDATAVRHAVLASLALLELASDAVTVPLLASVYRAPLPLAPDCSVWIYGRSGTFKTAITAVGQQHFGAGLDAQNLPGNWTSTSNSLEAQAFTLDSALFTVDDYSPDSTKVDAQRRAATADRLLRGSANHSGRGRLRPDGTMRPARPPRAQILTSAEDLPPGVESLRARVMIAEVRPGDVNLQKLAAAQESARNGTLALAMAGYVRSLAVRYDADSGLPAALACLRDRLRNEARDGGHPRYSLNIASLATGWHEYLAFACAAGAITAEEREDYWSRAWKALCDTGAEQDRYRRDADPVTVYLRALGSLLASGRAHLAASRGGPPPEASRWGWVDDMAGQASSERHPVVASSWRSKGDLLGWVDGDDIYLEPDAAFTAARQFAELGGPPLGIGQTALQKHLRDRNLLASTSKGRTTAQRDLGGERAKRVVHLTLHTFSTGGDTR